MNEIIKANARGLQLNSLEEMTRFADGVYKSGLAPATLKTSAQIVVALQVGLEIGLPPMVSLRSIYVIKGMPTLFGDAALALVKASPVCDYVIESIEGEGDAMFAKVVSCRKGGKPMTTTFSVTDAKQAKLWMKKTTGGDTTWVTHPKRMLKYKARAFNLRDNFPDILLGIHLTEEMIGEAEDLLEVPDCKTPTRENRRKAVVAEDITPDTAPSQDKGMNPDGIIIDDPIDIPDLTEKDEADLYSQLTDGFRELFPQGNFALWAAYVLCLEQDEVDSKDKFTQSMLMHLVREWNTKGFCDTEAGL